MDLSTSPADDFYRYANGGWLDRNPIPPEYASWSVSMELRVRIGNILLGLSKDEMGSAAEGASASDASARRFRDYVHAGLDELATETAGLAPIQPLLDIADAVNAPENFPGAVTSLQRAGVSVLHGLEIEPDVDDPSRYIAYVKQGGLGLPEAGYYTRDDPRSIEMRSAYVAHVAAQLGNLGALRTDALDMAANVVAFETRLAEHSWTPEQLRDLSRTLNRTAFDSLDALMARFRLADHLRALGVTGTAVIVDVPDFFRAVDRIVDETPLATLRAYLRWHIVRRFAGSLPAAFANEEFAFYDRTLRGQTAIRERWKRVLDAASEDIGADVGRQFVSVAFPAEAKARCVRMVGYLKAAMRRSLVDLTWMTGATRAHAIAKLDAMTFQIGYPEHWPDDAGLVIDQDSWAGNRVRAATNRVATQLRHLDGPIDHDDWFMPAHTVDAWYHPYLNEMTFPAGILQPPFFDADADEAFNLGSMGSVIGHEITHGFDDEGRRFDATGRRFDWWTESDQKEFERLGQRLAIQFDGYEAADGAHVNGQLTLGENIADLGGLVIALEALRAAVAEGTAEPGIIDGFTLEQRFFLAYAAGWRTNISEELLRVLVQSDPHAPPEFRVNGPLSNLRAFAEAFDISPGSSPMARAPEDCVRIW